ncbi:MAG: nucleotide exchange factor GrpE [Alphaproteobacteria bacterium]|nr:nucleotide exchange factor GrpE [Alphaproteobacteria bacterium]
MEPDQPNPDPQIEPAEPPAEAAPLDLEAVLARIAELEAERDELRDRWMRAEAENANVHARAKREVDETRRYAVQKFAADVVEAAENLRRGLGSLPPPGPGEPAIVGRLREGLEGIERSFLGILERNGIQRIDPTGALFDPELHQAMGEQVTEEHPPGTVVQAWTSGWRLNGRLLKPAMVVVAKAPAPELPQPANESRPGAPAGVSA